MSYSRLIIFLFGLVCVSAPAQVAVGLYAHGSYDANGFDIVDRGDLNVHFEIPVVNKLGRGLNFRYVISYDGLIWTPTGATGAKTWVPSTTWGFSGILGEAITGYVSYAQVSVKCSNPDPNGGANQIVPGTMYKNYVYHDTFGRPHAFTFTETTCVDPNTGDAPTIRGDGTAADGSGYTFNGSTVRAPNGSVIAAPLNSVSGSGSITDSNGNKISTNGLGLFTDTTGVTALTITGSGTPSSPVVLTYKTVTGTAAVTISYKTYVVQTSFGCSIGEYNRSTTLVDRITRADGSYYQFTYEPTSLGSTNVTGRLASVTLPTGGNIVYQYTGGSNGINCADGTATGLVRTTSDGPRTYARSSITSTTSHTDITDGYGNQSAFDFVIAGSPSEFLETTRSVFSGSQTGTPLLSRLTCYNGNTSACSTTVPTLPLSFVDVNETLDGIAMRGSSAAYYTNGMQWESDIYDFGTATSRGPKLLRENWTYSANIPDHVTLDAVYDGNSNLVAKASYSYDGSTPTASSGVPQHVAVTTARGNLTAITQYINATSTYQSSGTYEDTGTLLTSTTPNGTTTRSYDGTFTYATGLTLPTPSSGIDLGMTASYDAANSGLPLSSTDPNGQTGRVAAYDAMLRPTEIDMPDGGKTTLSYTPTTSDVRTYQTASAFSETAFQYDGYGRQSRIAIAQGGNSWYLQDFCYDASGNQGFSSYRYIGADPGASKVCSGAGDGYAYDARGRIKSVTSANGETTTYTYKGRATKVVDQNGVTRISQVDGLGRTTIVCEISSNSSMPGSGAPVACGTDISGTGFVTTYANNLANHTITTTQGVQTRTTQTDWLGRVTSTVEPESGTTTYSYAYNATGLAVTRNRPKANQSSATVLTTTITQYDKLGRIVSVAYSDGTPTKTFAYDASAGWNNFTQANLKGQLSIASVPGAATAYSYDPVGRVSYLDECLTAECGTSSYNRQLHYTYDLAGNLLTSTDGSSVQSTYTVSQANEVLSLTSSLSGSMNPTNILSGVQYGPYGPTGFGLGNGLYSVFGYDTLGRLGGGWVCRGSTSANCLGGTQVYGFTANWSGPQLRGSSDSVLNQGSTYGYDEFNRLTSLTVNSGAVQNYTYVYDRYGNRTQQHAVQGGLTTELSFTQSNNQIVGSGYSYDAAGNMTNDGFHSYTFDAEGNITAVGGGSTATYVYNAMNQRVRTTANGSVMEFLFDIDGQRVSTWNGTSHAQLSGQYYLGSKRVAYYAGGATHFQHQDWMGTERVRTTYNGNVEGAFTSLPFGDGQTTSGTDGDAYHYAMLDHDSEDSTDHAQFRQYSNTQGRWLSPDLYSGSYDMLNPQSMNRYSYVTNLPLSLVDPSGFMGVPPGEPGGGGGGIGGGYPGDPTGGGCGDDGGYGWAGGGGGGGHESWDDPGMPEYPPPPVDTNVVGSLKLRAMVGSGCGGGTRRGGGGGQSNTPNAGSRINKILQCASKLANQFSIAGIIGVDEKKHPFLASVSNAFLGNTFSGIVDTGTHVFNGKFGAGYTDFALGGTAQGLPLGSTASSKGLAGVLTEGAVGATLGEEMVTPVGWAKLGIDGAVFVGAVAYCANHL